MPTASWYLSRLARMSPREVAFRSMRTAESWWQRLIWNESSAFGLRQSGMPATRCLSAAAGAGVPDLALADAIVAGRLRVLGRDAIATDWPPEWNRDPKTGTLAPRTFGKHIDYRDERLVGDIKYLWEINRHLELPVLARSYAATGDDRYLSALRGALHSWIRECPFPMGANWCSALECAIRLINWSLTLSILDAEHDGGVLAKSGMNIRLLAASAAQHLHFISRNYSRFSSANNHRIGEAAGVFIGCLTWPDGNATGKLASQAKRILEDESRAQISEDGAGLEQAVGYLPFVLEFLVLAASAAETAGCGFSEAYKDRIRSAMRFVRETSSGDGEIANFGDNDDGAVVRLWGFDLPDRITGIRGLCETLWGPDFFRERNAQQSSGPIAFPEGGYYVLRSRGDRGPALQCVIDCGELGYESIAAHGHADALSLIVSVDGKQLLVDPGTYAYHTERRWRDYFRSTRAHNTLCVDGLDQSEIAGSFMWRSAAKAKCEEFISDENGQRFVGTHDGYMRLPDPVLHRRSVRLDGQSAYLYVEDIVECASEHDIELHWHAAPGCRVDFESDDTVNLQLGSTKVRLSIVSESPFSVGIVKGAEDPILGWYSDRFDRKTPISVIRCSIRTAGSAVIGTRILAADAESESPAKVGQAS